jgi:amino acid adenylation domain-containing protein
MEMVIGILGILKAGGAYLPLDPAYPKERLAFMLEDTGVSVLLTQERLLETLPKHTAKVICLDTDWESIQVRIDSSIQNSPPHPPLVRGEYEEGESQGAGKTQNPSSLAYAIYTSGSTGKPKGVLVTHQNLVHSTWTRHLYYHQPVTSFLLLSSFAFDSSVAGIFWTLCQGGMLVLPQDFQKDPQQLTELIARHRVSHLLTVPSFYSLLLEQAKLGQLDSLRVAIVAGEVCRKELVERHYQQLPQASLFNEYGPTEGTVWSSVYHCQPCELNNQIPIGCPIANTQIYLLDAQLQPVPIGIVGELYIGGAGVARGYLNRPELTAEKFIPNPFQPGERLYKTGDLACYLPDGTIKFLGRIDHQVKLRGFRLELGEIEAVLNQYPGVQDVAAIVREDESGDQRLVAYVVPSQQQVLTLRELRDFLKERLPDYMMPSAFVLLDSLPLLPNGKVDRHALPVPEGLRPTLAAAYEAPRSEVERAIATVWRSMLHLEKVGIHDNFFDLGGHSLLMVQVNNKLRDVFNRDLSIVELFQNPTISSLAQYLSQKSEETTAFEAVQNRVQKQLEAINKRKKLLTKQQNTH